METVGEAQRASWRVWARCVGRLIERGTATRKCENIEELDLQTLAWTRGKAFPLSMLETRLKCVMCGNRRISLIYEPPASSVRGTVRTTG